MRLTRSVYIKINTYIDVYIKRIIETENPEDILNDFDYDLAAQSIREALLVNGGLSGKIVEVISQPEFLEEIKTYINKRIPATYLTLTNPDMTVDIAEAFIRDKGSDFFPELKAIKSYSVAALKPYNYPASDAQINYIKNLKAELKHQDQLTGREANELIKSLKCKTRTKPFYYRYFIGGGIDAWSKT